MEDLILILASVSLLTVLPALLRLRSLVRQTTLATAAAWAFIAWGAWEIAWISRLFAVPLSIQDQLWYAAAVLGLCPPIAVLGAKRPGARVWAAFVLVPLVLVFAWPALVGWVHQIPPERLQLETPMLLGFGLVLVMGYGNYLGTRKTLPALLAAVALGWLAWELAKSPEPAQSLQPIGPTLLLISAAVLAVLSPSPNPEAAGWNRVWADFQEAFGIVWAKRIMDRINHTARQEHWAGHWDVQGLVFDPDATESQKAETLKRIDHTLRWLLRRFVDPEWIDQRLTPNTDD